MNVLVLMLVDRKDSTEVQFVLQPFLVPEISTVIRYVKYVRFVLSFTKILSLIFFIE
jgi:hypothetical protein